MSYLSVDHSSVCEVCESLRFAAGRRGSRCLSAVHHDVFYPFAALALTIHSLHLFVSRIVLADGLPSRSRFAAFALLLDSSARFWHTIGVEYWLRLLQSRHLLAHGLIFAAYALVLAVTVLQHLLCRTRSHLCSICFLSLGCFYSIYSPAHGRFMHSICSLPHDPFFIVLAFSQTVAFLQHTAFSRTFVFLKISSLDAFSRNLYSLFLIAFTLSLRSLTRSHFGRPSYTAAFGCLGRFHAFLHKVAVWKIIPGCFLVHGGILLAFTIRTRYSPRSLFTIF